MKAIKKKISLILAGLMVAGAAATMPVKAEGGALPPVPTVTLARVSVNEGDQPKVLVTTDYDEDVQYMIWYQDAQKEWHHTDYTDAVDGRIPYALELPAEVTKGQNCVSVWVKRASVAEDQCEFVKEAGGRDNHGFYFFEGFEKAYSAGNIDYTIDGTNVTVNGVKGMASTAEFKVNYVKIGETGYDTSINDWQVAADYSTEAATFELEPGYYYLNVHVNDSEYVRPGASEDSWDAYTMDIIKIEEKAAGKTVEFTTEIVKNKYDYNMTVSSDSDEVVSYRLSDADGPFDKMAMGEATTGIIQKPAMFTVEFFAADGTVIATEEVVPGEDGSFTIEEKEVKEYTVEISEVGNPFSEITVTCEDAEVDSFRIFKGEEEITVVSTKIGEAGRCFKKVNAGEEIIVKLYDANGALLGNATATVE